MYRPMNSADAAGPVICDGFRLTLPETAGADLCRELRPVLDAVCAVEHGDGLFRRGATGPVLFKRGRYGRVAVLSFNGALLALLRGAGMLEDLVVPCAGYPRRQTRTDVALDFAVDAPPVLRALYAAGRAGKVALSRKAVPGRSVGWRMGVSTATGEDTGTVYLGERGVADVCAAVYDKRQERQDKGHSDPGPLLRVEVRVADVGAVLGDVLSPERLFHHYAAPDLVRGPPDAGDWVPHADGFVLPQRAEFTAAERCERLVLASPDVARALDLSLEACGDASLVLHFVKRRAELRATAARIGSAGGMGAERPMPSPAVA